MSDAFAALEDATAVGPVMTSVHYTFEPTNPIPHLVVVSSINDGLVYYNDPAEPNGGGSISIAQFQSAWKKRYITIRPV
jgi:predicted double-glycine peptidase